MAKTFLTSAFIGLLKMHSSVSYRHVWTQQFKPSSAYDVVTSHLCIFLKWENDNDWKIHNRTICSESCFILWAILKAFIFLLLFQEKMLLELFNAVPQMATKIIVYIRGSVQHFKVLYLHSSFWWRNHWYVIYKHTWSTYNSAFSQVAPIH